MSALILALGLTFFPGQPHWYELDTSGVEWTVHQVSMFPYNPTLPGQIIEQGSKGKTDTKRCVCPCR